jgi:nitronate monooxygenase
MWKSNELTELLSIEYPIIQGPFGGGQSSVELTATVSEAGGLGSFGANATRPEQIIETVTAIRQKTANPFAVNLWVSDADDSVATFTKAAFDRHVARLRPYFEALEVETPEFPVRFGQSYEEQVEALLTASPPVFSFVYGIPSQTVLAACRDRHIVTVGTATTVEEAVALEQAGVDAVVATGSESGGHRVSFLKAPEDSFIGTFALVQLVRARVKIPVIAAGAITGGHAIAAALALGADGVQIGTAFLACEESAASPSQRDFLFSEGHRETVLTRVFTGRLARSLRNDLSNLGNGDLAETAPYPVQNWLIGQLKAAAIARGNLDLVALMAGQGVPLLTHRRAAALFEACVRDTDAVFHRLAAN